MDYKETVQLARTGDERGFQCLYESTYQSKYYLALQYMKQKEAAEDVLQDAYVRAFTRLDTLEAPERFPAWLGQIVANTAKNALAKNQPLLFTDVAEEMEDFAELMADEGVASQPELAYTMEETRALVHELLDALSDEQRLCVLMFHLEGASIKEIAQTLGCSENTVKSRLNYGRKNLKAKAEELQEKGYTLYNIAPLPLLLLLLRGDQSYMLAEGAIQAGSRMVADRVFAQLPGIGAAHGYGQAAAPGIEKAEGIGTGAAKSGFLHTAAGKAAAAVLSLCILGGAFYGITQMAKQETPEEPKQEAPKEPKQEAPEEPKQEAPEETESEPDVPKEAEQKATNVADADYPNLLEGNLTKEELEFIIAYGPETLTGQGLPDAQYPLILNCWCEAAKASGRFLTPIGSDANYRDGFQVDDVNRYLSSFTDYRFTEDNDSDTPYGNDVDGDTIWVAPAELSFEATAAVTDAAYLGDTMVVHFSYEKNSYEQGLTAADKTATLKKNANGRFRIITIEEGTAPLEGTAAKANGEDVKAENENTAPIRTIYEGILKSVQSQEEGYGFPNANGSTDYQYFLWDMDGDGIQELIVGAMFEEDVFELYDIRVFTVSWDSSGYTPKPIAGDIVSMVVCLPSDGKGLYSMDMSRGTGVVNIYRMDIEGDALSLGSSPELTYTMGDNTGAQFANSNPYAEWISASNQDGLMELE